MGRPKGSWSGSANPNWKGGCRIASGYSYILMPDHPNSNKNGYVREHVLVMSNHLQRAITKNEIVHHINGIRRDNRIENLVLTTQSLHTSHHHKGLIKPNSIKNLRPATSESMKNIWNTTMNYRRIKPKPCELCGKKIIRRGSKKRPVKYCSRACSNRVNRNIQKFNLMDQNQSPPS